MKTTYRAMQISRPGLLELVERKIAWFCAAIAASCPSTGSDRTS